MAVATGDIAALGKGRAQRPGVVLQRGVGLQRVGGVAPDRGAAGACAGGVAALHRKAVLAAPDDGAVIVAAAGQPHKIIHRHGGCVRVQYGAHLTQTGGEDGDGVAVAGRGKLALLADELVGARGGLFGVAAAAAQQHGGQQQGQAGGTFHGRSSGAFTNLDKDIIPHIFCAEHP